MKTTFTLYILKVEVIGNASDFACSHTPGDFFEVHGENLIFPQTNTFSMYTLGALLPLLPAKQRQTEPADWMTTDSDIACPDPNCQALFRITRIGTESFEHADVTKVPLHES